MCAGGVVNSLRQAICQAVLCPASRGLDLGICKMQQDHAAAGGAATAVPGAGCLVLISTLSVLPAACSWLCGRNRENQLHAMHDQQTRTWAGKGLWDGLLVHW